MGKAYSAKATCNQAVVKALFGEPKSARESFAKIIAAQESGDIDVEINGIKLTRERPASRKTPGRRGP